MSDIAQLLLDLRAALTLRVQALEEQLRASGSEGHSARSSSFERISSVASLAPPPRSSVAARPVELGPRRGADRASASVGRQALPHLQLRPLAPPPCLHIRTEVQVRLILPTRKGDFA